MASPFLAHGYSSAKLIHSGRLSQVFAAIRAIDGQRVVLKHYTREAVARSSPKDEWDALAVVAGPGVPQPLELFECNDRPVVVLEHAPGVTLASWVRTEVPPLRATLCVGEQIARILARVHAAHLIHRDLNPGNVLVDPDSLATHMIDFGLARPLGSTERPGPTSSGAPGGSLQFIAPEQTGRMNRGADARSDLYTLGTLLYFCLAGRPPFVSRDPLELIHSHIARVAPPLSGLCPELPHPVVAVVTRLLTKEPEERYQTAAALAHDLAALCAELTARGSIAPSFSLESAAADARPRYAAALYGRAEEEAVVTRAYERTREGAGEIVLIEGPPGMGKSSLVQTLRPKVAELGGYLAIAKFEPYRDRAYAGWADLIHSLVQQMLLESDARLAVWRERLRAELGAVAGALVELVPDLTFIIGEVETVPTLAPRETRVRLSLALRRLITACAQPDHPLALFLDDLQWSDAGSRQVLEQLAGDRCPQSLLLICAYRSDARESPAIASVTSRMDEGEAAVHRLALRPLTRAEVAHMVADALSRTPEETAELAGWIERKTHGNPLTVRQFLDYLHDRALLRFTEQRGWEWDTQAIAGLDVPDNAVGLLTAKLDRLGPDPKAILCLASCAGDGFDAALLCRLTEHDPQTVSDALYELADLGLMAPCARGFRFAHDRIREAARALLSPDQRAALHADIAMLLLERASPAERSERIFEIADHVNLGNARLAAHMRRTALELNREAGQRALASGAADTAERYLSEARARLQEEDWQKDPRGTFALWIASAEAAFQRHDFALARSLIDAAMERPLDVLERARLAAKRIQVLGLTEDVDVSVRYALEALRPYGIRWSQEPSRLHAMLAILHVRHALRGAADRDAIRARIRPSTELDPARIGALVILHQSSALMARVSGYLATLSTAYCLRDVLANGFLAAPNFLLACYATYDYIFLRDGERARRVAKVAIGEGETASALSDPLRQPQTELMVHGVLNPFLMSRRRALRSMPQIERAIEELGDLEWTFYARYQQAMALALAGDPLEIAETRLRDAVRMWGGSPRSRAEIDIAADALALLRRGDVGGAIADAPALHASLGSGSAASPQGITLWMQSLCVLGDDEAVLALSDRLGVWLHRLNPWAHVVDHTLYRGLAAGALARSRGRARGIKARFILSRCARAMRAWAVHGPDFEHMTLMLAAEQAAVRRRRVEAAGLYERAARGARRQEFPHHVAICHERRAAVLAAANRTIEAESARAEAADLYRSWGAMGKADALGAPRSDTPAPRGLSRLRRRGAR